VCAIGCKGKTEAPAEPAAAPAVPDVSAQKVEPEPGPVKVEKPRVHMRLLVEAPKALKSLEQPALDKLKATLFTGDKELAKDLPVTSLRKAREGMAALVVVIGKTPRAAHLSGARSFLETLGPDDRVAVGAITEKGFQIVNDFSADTQGAATALRYLGKPGKGKAAPEAPVPLYRGLHQALDVFRGRTTLPAVRSLIVMTDGRDASLRRSSQYAQAETAVLLRAAYHAVRLHAIGLEGDPKALERIKQLTVRSGGSFGPVVPERPTTPAFSAAFTAVGHRVRRRIVVDANLADIPAGPTPLTVKIGDWSVTGQIKVPSPSGAREAFDVGLPAPPDRVLPLGVTADRNLAGEAATAEKAKDFLRAGVLWHLAAQTSPENRNAVSKAKEMDTAMRSRKSELGTFITSSTKVPIDTRIEFKPDLLAEVWRDELMRETTLEEVVRERVLPPEDPDAQQTGDPLLHQVVLHRCPPTPEGCLRQQLLDGTATHLHIDAGGKVTQLVDLSRVILKTGAEDGAAILIGLAVPSSKALAPQSAGHRAAWRHTRGLVKEVECNDVRGNGWDLTGAQYASLVPLLSGVTRFYADLQPALPIDLERKETFEKLLYPKKFNGVMCRSNLGREFGADPTPALQLARLNKSVPLWSRRTARADLESWLRHLPVPGRQLGAISRFVAIGKDAAPLLVEAATELPAVEARYAVRALSQIGLKTAGPAVASLIGKTAPTEDEDPVSLALRLEALEAVARVGTPAELPAINNLFIELMAAPDEQHAQLPALRLMTAQVIVALAETPAHIAILEPLLTNEDAALRGQAAMAIALHDPKGGKLAPALTDAQPWIRLVAATAAGEEGVAVITSLKDKLPIGMLAGALAKASPSKPVPQTLGWWNDADRHARHALSDLYALWKWPAAVKALAPRLKAASDNDRAIVYRALKRITGRDFGSGSAQGWLSWKPEATP